MLHFAYPNVDGENFLGCGRYVTAPLDRKPTGYELAKPNIPNLEQVTCAALFLAPESGDTHQEVYEIRDKSPRPFVGESLDFAYLLALISRSRKVKLKGFTHDIWCTGLIQMDSGYRTPSLEVVRNRSGFTRKLKAFLSPEETPVETIFFVPSANITAPDKLILQDSNVNVFSLGDWQNTVPYLSTGKAVLKVHGSELRQLVEIIFEPLSDIQSRLATIRQQKESVKSVQDLDKVLSQLYNLTTPDNAVIQKKILSAKSIQDLDEALSLLEELKHYGKQSSS